MPSDLQPPDPALTAAQLNDLRARVAAGETVSPEEYGSIIASIRQSRLAAAATPRKAKSKSTPIDLDQLTDL